MQSILSVLTLLLLVYPSAAIGARSRNAYPNELPGLKFYAEHLSPLRPYISDSSSVVRVLGSNQGIKLDGWSLTPHFVGGGTVNGRPWAHDIKGRLASVIAIPTRRISMLSVKFPAAFTHSVGGVSEINVSCDIYKDKYGLEYWIHSEDSAAGAKGDLLRIVYGPSKRIEKHVVGQ